MTHSTKEFIKIQQRKRKFIIKIIPKTRSSQLSSYYKLQYIGELYARAHATALGSRLRAH